MNTTSIVDVVIKIFHKNLCFVSEMMYFCIVLETKS